MKKIYMIFVTTALLAACATGSRKPEAYCGTFGGVFTSAENGQIEEILQLNKDGSFNSIMMYANSSDNIFTEQGNYTVTGETVKLVPFNGEPSYYKVEKNALRRTDNQRHLLMKNGRLANNYILKKTSCCK